MAEEGRGYDLDVLAAGYAHRPSSAAALRRADRAARRAALGFGRLAVDVGGGRGFHAERFAATGADAIVVDRSPAMAAAAVQRRSVRAVVGDARRLPLRDGVADLVWFHTSIHYGEWARMLDEALRIARPGALVAVWTFRPDHARESFLTRWFPTIGEIDAERFPDPALLAEHLRAGGCRDVGVIAEDEHVVRSAGSWEAGVRGRFVSTLQAIDTDELDRGLDAFRDAHPDPGESVAYLLRYAEVSGRTPSLR